MRHLKIFLIVLILGSLFYFGNKFLGPKLTDFFFWLEMAKNPQILAAQEKELAFERNLRALKPIRNNETPNLEIIAKSAISVFVDNQGKERVIFDKLSNERLPIASITKLMTAKVVLENYDLDKEIRVSQEAVEQDEDFGKLQASKVYPVEYLLYPLLMESSNDAAFSLYSDYDGMNRETFLGLMNFSAQKMGLQDTYFFNATGLEPEEDPNTQDLNYSTAADLAKMTKELLKIPLLWEILATPAYNLYGPELKNTNELLGEITGILGGKTGYTEKAQGCFLLVVQAPKSKGVLVNVILGSNNNRFEEMRKLVNWTKEAYEW